MLYLATAQPATVQLHAIKCDFLAQDKDCLVINKLTRLEVFTTDLEQNSLRLALEIPVFSTVAALCAVKLPGHSTSTLVILTTSLQLFAVTYSPTAPHIITTSTVSIHEQFGRLSEYQTILVDPALQALVVLAYSGVLRVIPLAPPAPKVRRGSKASSTRPSSDSTPVVPQLDLTRGYNVRLPSYNITSIAFLPSSDVPILATVYFNNVGRRIFQSQALDLEEKELDDEPIVQLALDDPGSEILIPVEGQDGSAGFVVVGEESLAWVGAKRDSEKGKGKAEGASSAVRCRLPVGNVQAWTSFDDDPNRFLLGDIYGKLIALTIVRNDSGRVIALETKDLGDTASPTALVFLSPTLLYLASRFGDSQVILLPSGILNLDKDAMEIGDGAAEGLQLVSSIASLAPILDFCVVEGDGGGASHVVTCSGAYKGGSLRVVRQGVGLSELASLEMENIQRLWSIKRGFSDELLVLGFFDETRVLSFGEDDEIEEVDLPAFAGDKASLLVSIVGALTVQVTADGVTSSNSETNEVGAWGVEEKRKITLAASDEKYVLLSREGGEVVLLEGLATVASHQFDNEVSCLDIFSHGGQTVAVVALWTVNTVHLVALPSFEVLTTQAIDTTFLVRSVLLATFSDNTTHLFAGLGDGTLTSYGVDTSNFSLIAGTEKTVTIGTKPVTVYSFAPKGVVNVFASSDRPTIISRAGDRLVYSSVNLKEIAAVVPFNSTSYPTTIALASPASLRIGRIEDIQRVDVRAIPLDEEEPRRIAHDAVSRTYGVILLRRDIDRETGEQTTVGSVKIFDDETFEVLGSFPLQPSEEGQSLVVASSGSSTFYAVGTTLVDLTEQEPTKGRILLFSSGEDRAFSQTSEVEIGGCPYALATPGPGKIAAAVNSQVIVYSVDPTNAQLETIATWGGAFVAFNLVSPSLNRLIVGDALRSVSLLELKDGPSATIEEVARDYSPHYMAALESTTEHEFLGADTDLNVFALEKESVAAGSMTDEDSLSPRGVFHLGEMVTRFQRGSLVQQLGDALGAAKPRLVFTTSAGSLGVVIELDAATSKLLSDLERNMRHVIESAGGLTQEDWRAFKSERETKPSAGFVDGDFVERFAQLSDEEVQKVMAGRTEHEALTVSVVEVGRVVDEMTRLH